MSIALVGAPNAVASLRKNQKYTAKFQSTYHVVHDRGSISGREKKAYTICVQVFAYMSDPNSSPYCMTSTTDKIRTLLHRVGGNHVLK
jgi:hypothetical protein